MAHKATAGKEIQVYLKYPGSKMFRFGTPVSQQRATEMALAFSRTESQCIPGGKVSLTVEVSPKKMGKIIFKLPYNKPMAFLCDTCGGACDKQPTSPDGKLKKCRENIRHGLCKDPAISSIVGFGVYTEKYQKTR